MENTQTVDAVVAAAAAHHVATVNVSETALTGIELTVIVIADGAIHAAKALGPEAVVVYMAVSQVGPAA